MTSSLTSERYGAGWLDWQTDVNDFKSNAYHVWLNQYHVKMSMKYFAFINKVDIPRPHATYQIYETQNLLVERRGYIYFQGWLAMLIKTPELFVNPMPQFQCLLPIYGLIKKLMHRIYSLFLISMIATYVSLYKRGNDPKRPVSKTPNVWV